MVGTNKQFWQQGRLARSLLSGSAEAEVMGSIVGTSVISAPRCPLGPRSRGWQETPWRHWGLCIGFVQHMQLPLERPLLQGCSRKGVLSPFPNLLIWSAPPSCSVFSAQSYFAHMHYICVLIKHSFNPWRCLGSKGRLLCHARQLAPCPVLRYWIIRLHHVQQRRAVVEAEKELPVLSYSGKMAADIQRC